ncbi:YebC/PmpR family DNA-binding transcriptional regulator [Weissella paramesenteroides]|uniref:YebC/PmpR family DNA-binding transcriptional regulator n=1 Tax=Weissella paramesenteroides TaxID=1249 RepID=UPI00123BF849|nr:YebC/PmpR family DNA-binding transcriptional regulator [Weissella paramesenteroides]KAA8455355.1 YebC/PmpR family DNA-binding transcriptional regulator [Weissella paramesenteroides]KAA8456181.1 YebC/PmpR family DNA-binding transcriptional regulator [Weissella paramesenteroides]KAA8457816.1 YebC/PmpR family DNA-binding transcriptional regulator [Weissella paramesenteroides]KAA8461796.1 YebC/PmpR family DNA-binding transcriptional regulator [Weissella paramesenteroides]KAA8462491.1 YebC/PmpR 
MSGHSKWHNIQGRKNAQDAKRGKIFQKLARDLYTAAKAGGVDPDSNSSLRLVIDKAKAANMPKDNIQRALDKASGANGANYQELTYEGYGPAGIAVLVEALTDNTNRTASSVRSSFKHFGGELGTSGSVSFQFDRKGYLEIERDEDTEIDEDQLFEDMLDAGAEDMKTFDDQFEIYTDPKSFPEVRDTLAAKGYQFSIDEVTMVAQNPMAVPEDKQESLDNLVAELEENDDVQAVFTTAE